MSIDLGGGPGTYRVHRLAPVLSLTLSQKGSRPDLEAVLEGVEYQLLV